MICGHPLMTVNKGQQKGEVRRIVFEEKALELYLMALFLVGLTLVAFSFFHPRAQAFFSGTGLMLGWCSFYLVPFFSLVLHKRQKIYDYVLLALNVGMLFTLAASAYLFSVTWGVFIFCLILTWSLTWRKYRKVRSRAYFDGGQAWYELSPRKMVGVFARNSNQEYFVSRFTLDGAYLIFKNSKPNALTSDFYKVQKFDFHFKDLKVTFPASVITLNSTGLGIRFMGLSWVEQKFVMDFIEKLRGEGYEIETS
jgi:hypothetical protein